MGEIADSLDFNGKTALNVVNVINALSVGLPFFGVSTQSQLLPSHSTKPSPDPVPTKRIPILRPPLLQIGKTFAQSLQQTPTVTNALWNATQDPTNQTLSVRYMGQQLPTSDILNRIYNDLNAGLSLIMTDIPTFLNFQRLRRLVHPQPHPTNRSHKLNTRHRSCALDIRDIRNTSPAELLSNASRDWQRPGFRSPFQCLER